MKTPSVSPQRGARRWIKALCRFTTGLPRGGQRGKALHPLNRFYSSLLASKAASPYLNSDSDRCGCYKNRNGKKNTFIQTRPDGKCNRFTTIWGNGHQQPEPATALLMSQSLNVAWKVGGFTLHAGYHFFSAFLMTSTLMACPTETRPARRDEPWYAIKQVNAFNVWGSHYHLSLCLREGQALQAQTRTSDSFWGSVVLHPTTQLATPTPPHGSASQTQCHSLSFLGFECGCREGIYYSIRIYINSFIVWDSIYYATSSEKRLTMNLLIFF